jgi:hypothetical protein
MKVWITKYALTQGITEIDAEVCESGGGSMIRKLPNTYFGEYYHGEGKDWHKTRESAIARAEKMRAKKLVSLRKQTKELEEMVFE